MVSAEASFPSPALFGNVAATESSVANTFRNYKDTLFVFMPTYSLYAFQFNPVQAYAVSNLLTKDKQEGLADAVEATIHKGILCSKATNNISSFEKKPENKGIPDIANDETNIVM